MLVIFSIAIRLAFDGTPGPSEGTMSASGDEYLSAAKYMMSACILSYSVTYAEQIVYSRQSVRCITARHLSGLPIDSIPGDWYRCHESSMVILGTGYPHGPGPWFAPQCRQVPYHCRQFVQPRREGE